MDVCQWMCVSGCVSVVCDVCVSGCVLVDVC